MEAVFTGFRAKITCHNNVINRFHDREFHIILAFTQQTGQFSLSYKRSWSVFIAAYLKHVITLGETTSIKQSGLFFGMSFNSCQKRLQRGLPGVPTCLHYHLYHNFKSFDTSTASFKVLVLLDSIISVTIEALLGGGGCPCPLSEFHKQLCRQFARSLCRLSEFRLRRIVTSVSLSLFRWSSASFVASSWLSCRRFKAMSLVEIYP